MIIRGLELKNWLIFKGDQKVNMAHGDANITIIFGENMHGKTGLMNALRWCLYGHAVDRYNREIPTNELINSLAKKEGQTICAVKTNFLVDQKNYELSRELNFSEGQPKMATSLKIEGRLVEGGKIQTEIEKVLPEQISQFMLFDGELLKQFEDLVVSEGSTQATGIKNAIEQNLGIPILRKALEAAQLKEKDLKKKRNEYLKKDKNSQLIASKISELETKMEVNIDSQKKVGELIDSYEVEASNLRQQLDQNEAALKLIGAKGEQNRILSDLKKKEHKVQSEIAEISESLYLAPLKEAVSPKLASLKEQLGQLKEQEKSTSSKVTNLLKLKKSLGNSICPTCGHTLSDTEIGKIKEEVEELETSLASNSGIEDLIFDLQTQIKGLDLSIDDSDYTNRHMSKVLELQSLVRDISTAENEIYQIEQSLKGVDEQQSETIRAKYDRINKEIGEQEKVRKDLEEEYETLDKELISIRKSDDFTRIKGDSTIVEESEKAIQVVETLQKAIFLYRDQMRSDVESRATLAFKNLTTEETFDKLEINENYGLNLIVDGQKVRRSAGAEQIVAMSLIEALNFHGRRLGPIIMDTPGGRLDKKHRKKVLEYLPKVVTQFAIFVHSGELEEDDESINPSKVGARYKVRRHSTFSAELVRL